MKEFFITLSNLITTLSAIASVTYLVHDDHPILSVVVGAAWLLLIAMHAAREEQRLV